MSKENMNNKAVAAEVSACRRELFEMKLNLASGQVKDTSQFRKIRKKIARLLTQMNAATGEQSMNDNAE